MNEIKIFENDKQDNFFYSIMGEHFASLEHKKELNGWQLYNKSNSTWFLLFIDNSLTGFCAIFKEKNFLNLDNFIILKEYRRNGYSKILLDFVLDHYKNCKIKTMTNNEHQIKNFESRKLVRTRIKGSYLVYERL